ncbi:hypothetical protein M5K25_011829 [Dendrobium thyrsiflorum]|uniref:Uncharacterized protein n=1 Tax=Dendrobium thyrsiflorum TaxID=117978 RepID=A0ABD0V3C3_DENTH
MIRKSIFLRELGSIPITLRYFPSDSWTRKIRRGNKSQCPPLPIDRIPTKPSHRPSARTRPKA